MAVDTTTIPVLDNLDDYVLDPLGQLPLLNIYTQICLCYHVPDDSLYPKIISTLNHGLQRVGEAIPWIAGQLVNDGACEGNTGTFRVKPLEKSPRLIIRDYRQDDSAPTMKALRQAEFPFHLLDETTIASRTTLPIGPPQPDTPAFIVQASLIKGGLVLTFHGQHNLMDMAGQYQVMNLISRACNNEPFTNQEVNAGNFDRQHLVPLLDDSYEPGEELSGIIVPEKADGNVGSGGSDKAAAWTAPPESSWSYMRFTAASISTLKALATETITLPPPSYITTDDALTAFIWQSITRARLSRLSRTTATLPTTAKLSRAVDARRYFNIPSTYPGLLQNMTYHSFPLSDLPSLPLGAIASSLRAAVDPRTTTVPYRTSAAATILSRSPDKSNVSFTASFDASVDVMLSSWAKFDCYGLDFGLGLGSPEAVRRPRFTPVEGLVYLLPRRGDGEIVVGLCLRNEDLEYMRADDEVKRYASWIG